MSVILRDLSDRAGKLKGVYRGLLPQMHVFSLLLTSYAVLIHGRIGVAPEKSIKLVVNSFVSGGVSIEILADD